MEAESLSGEGLTIYDIPRDVLTEASQYSGAVWKALSSWAKAVPETFDGPNWDMGISPREIADTLMEEEAAYLYFMEAEGHGVGTWDGRWDRLVTSDKHLKALSKDVAKRTSRQQGKLKDAIFNAANELVESHKTASKQASAYDEMMGRFDKGESGILFTSKNKQLEVFPKNGKNFNLAEAQKHVGGYVQLVYARVMGKKALILMDEEGQLKGQTLNRGASQLANMPLVGDVLFCRSKMFK
jgi:hypothetical protein